MAGLLSEKPAVGTSPEITGGRSTEEPEAVLSIGDYALVGDCRTAALVSRTGSIDWLCLPNFSAPSIFARLLDPSGGGFSIRPREPFTITRRYLDGAPVLETTFRTRGGAVRVLDAISVLDGVHTLHPMREILRIVEGCDGEVDMLVEIAASRLRAHPRKSTATAGDGLGLHMAK